MTLLKNFLKTKKAQKVLTTKPGEEGFSLVELVVVIAVLAILSAVAVPAFVGVQANARASAVKNGLVNGIKECVVLESDNKDPVDTAAQSYQGNYNGYTVSAGASTSCYDAYAEPSTAAKRAKESAFTISMDTNTGVVTKTCTNPETGKIAPGCSSGLTW